MKLFLATLSLTLVITANAVNALSIVIPVCEDPDGTIYEEAIEMQEGIFAAYLQDAPNDNPSSQTVLLLSCTSGTRINILNETHWVQEIFDQLQAFADSEDVYTFEDIAEELNESGLQSFVETFDKNSCICGDNLEVN